MNPIGKIRIKSIGKLLPPNNIQHLNEEIDTNPETSDRLLQTYPDNLSLPIKSFDPVDVEEKIELQSPTDNLSLPSEICEPEYVQCNSFSPITPKIENVISVECVDLTEDKFVTPIRKNLRKEKSDKRTQKKNVTSSKANNENKRQRKQGTLSAISSSSAKPKNITSSQTKFMSFFTPSSAVKRAPKKLGKLSETTNNTSSQAVDRPRRELRSLSLRRKLLKADDEDEPDEIKKTKIEVESKKPNNSKIKGRQKNLNNSKSKNRTKNINKSKSAAEDEPTVIPGVIDLCLDSDSDEDKKLEVKSPAPAPLPKRPATLKSEKSICPSYKVIEGTTFAVDGFKFGRIEGVTAYFLSHYHSDHYIGLTRKFSMPLYLSQITANLMREFIPVDEKFVNVLPLNTPTTIEGVQVTAIDANHCPGAVMFLFQLPCGKRILHTGDFRASIEMESDPHLSQRNIDLVYLDTTYISHNYSFQTQEKSIIDALRYVREFKERNEGKRILFVVGAYLVGKEKFWLPIAKEFDFKIWTDSNRRRIMHAIADQEILQRLVSKPQEANMHIISMMKIGYRGIESYWEDHAHEYDMIFAIRPSGWEKNSKPQFRGQINIVGIEYSEHSSHSELRRFLSFLRPQEVISTVPYGKDQTLCPDVPLSWYKKECFSPIKKQASMLDYFKCSKIENTKS